MIEVDDLTLYRNFKHGEILNLFVKIINEESTNIRKDIFTAIDLLVEFGVTRNFKGNLWHNYLAFILVNNENAFSIACEKKGHVDGSVNDIAINDFKIFKKLFDYDFHTIEKDLHISFYELISNYRQTEIKNRLFNPKVSLAIYDLSVALSRSTSYQEFFDLVVDFYLKYGVGKYGLHKAFRILNVEEQPTIKAINNIEPISFNDIIGYEWQKEALLKNTINFLESKRANNVLLYGDSGTGKSSSIKALINEFYDRGLRMIEVYKHQFQDLPAIISELKNRNYKFIIYMDDLSFEDFEIEYKYLKAVIEGGLETKPDNVLIYATSNRRHLVREKMSDADDYSTDKHTSETVQEKLSLAARFGLSLLYSAPNKAEFENIVLSLAKKSNIKISEEELLKEANKWQMRNGFSGRSAEQFIKSFEE